MERIQISEIRIGKRHRQDMGDMASLTRSMRDIGLLQPIGITNKNELVFGERRLKAAEELGWKTIHAVRVNLESIIDGEYAENEVRKDFTVSERVAIGQALEEKLSNRAGKRPKGNVVNLPHLGQKTRDLAAEKAGFGSEKTYRDAKKVVDEAEPEVKEAMDSGDVSVSDAAAVATEKPSVQRAAVKAVKAGKSKTLRQAAGKKKPKSAGDAYEGPDESEVAESKILRDGLGAEVPKKLRDAFSDTFLTDTAKMLESLPKRFKSIQSWAPYLKLKESTEQAEALAVVVRDAIPFAVHTRCEGKGCNECRKSGYVSQWRYEELNINGDW